MSMKTRSRTKSSTFNLVSVESNKEQSKDDKQTVDDKYRSDFDYVLANIERSRRFNRMELIAEEEFDYDLTAILTIPKRKRKAKLDFVANIMDERHAQTDQIEMITRGERDINNLAKINELIDKQPLKTVATIKELDFDAICFTIYSNASKLSSLMRDTSVKSFYRRVFDAYGYPGIAANINTSLFEKWQIFYIIGCLNGLFERSLRSKLFMVVYPETLLRIFMKVHNLKYSEALSRFKPSASDDSY